MNIRKGAAVATVEKTADGKVYTAQLVNYTSINAAKKANGLNATTLRGNQPFPPKLDELGKAA